MALTCPICYNLYKEPIIIGCGHTFCKLCIERLKEIRRPKYDGDFDLIRCPICRKCDSSDNVQYNYSLMHAVDLYVNKAQTLSQLSRSYTEGFQIFQPIKHRYSTRNLRRHLRSSRDPPRAQSVSVFTSTYENILHDYQGDTTKSEVSKSRTSSVSVTKSYKRPKIRSSKVQTSPKVLHNVGCQTAKSLFPSSKTHPYDPKLALEFIQWKEFRQKGKSRGSQVTNQVIRYATDVIRDAAISENMARLKIDKNIDKMWSDIAVETDFLPHTPHILSPHLSTYIDRDEMTDPTYITCNIFSIQPDLHSTDTISSDEISQIRLDESIRLDQPNQLEAVKPYLKTLFVEHVKRVEVPEKYLFRNGCAMVHEALNAF